MEIAKNVTQLIGSTSLIELGKMSKEVNARILLKLENQNPGGSVKDRLALSEHVHHLAHGRVFFEFVFARFQFTKKNVPAPPALKSWDDVYAHELTLMNQ